MKEALRKASPFFFIVALLGLIAALSACGARSLPRYTLSPKDKDPQRRLYPLSSSTITATARTPSLSAEFAGDKIRVRVPALAGEQWPAFGQRVLQDPLQWRKVQNLNGRRGLRPHREVHVPFALLNSTYQRAAIAQVFPHDEMTAKGWRHVVTYPGETLWFIAETLTGDGNTYVRLQKENNLAPQSVIRRGQSLVIPVPLLRSELRPAVPLASAAPSSESLPGTAAERTKSTVRAPDSDKVPSTIPANSEVSETSIKTSSKPAPAARDRRTVTISPTPELVFRTNARGEREAVYRLKKGEALYSAVVVRFTGRIDADEVNSIAQKLMAYNGIRDATRIADNTPIRIPAHLLDENILRGEIPPAPITRPTQKRNNDLHVILDAGHGGNDPGTRMRGWAEDEIAYDLMLRIKRGLQSHGVKVYSTVRDRETGDAIDGGRTLTNNRNEYVKVTPEYYMDDSRIAVNMRIYLIEDLYRWLLRQGVAPENILFISVHLDHLHPSLGGAMVYFPGAGERTSYFKAAGSIYRHYKESRIGTIRFNRSENERAESLSFSFAQDLIRTFRQTGVPVHDYQPIRRYVYRHDRKWSPGIIRYSRVPTSVLLEAANLTNRGDLARIRSANFRQKLAEAVVRAII